MRRFALIAVALCGQGACSLVYDVGSLQSGGDAASNDSGADDSGAPSELVNGGFEQSGGGCGPGWSPSSGATMNRSSIAHSGSSSCELCSNGTSSASLSATPTPAFPLAPSTTLYAEAWVKVEGTSSSQIVLDVEEIVSGGETLVNQPGAPQLTGWQKLSSYNLSPPKDGGTGASFAIHDTGIDGGPPSCVLIDDVVLTVQ